MIRFSVGLVCMFAVIFGALALEGIPIMVLFGFTPFLIVFLIPLIASASVWKWGELGRAWKDAFSKVKLQESSRTSISIWDFFEKTYYASGILGTLMGFTFVFSIMNQTKPEEFLPKLGVCLLSLCYGVIFGIIAKILKMRVNQRMTK